MLVLTPFTQKKSHTPVRQQSLGVKRKELSFAKDSEDRHFYPNLPARQKVDLSIPTFSRGS